MDKPNLNFSQEELNKFNKLTDHWWDPEGDFYSLHMLNPLRFDYIKKHTDLRSKKCLDVGCGGGILTESLATKASKVTGIDLAENALIVAKEHSNITDLENINYVQTTVEDHCEKNKSKYDVLTCMEMLEHVPNPEQIVKACSSGVKQGGHLYFSTINRNLKSFLMAIVGAEYILKLLPKGTHEYDQLIKPSEMDQWARNANLKLIDLSGVSYNPINETFKLSRDVSVNYMMHFIKN
jgi:2-polyprenyl-6-hydroxyphenyl methylase/3-demethylubiquinone-9 3-methyltransferase|tara:strand:+ start:143 stop:853 length:711 start_codon:yes stop_codon:yes gene_type:complete